jgi:hypothetical protein
MEPAILSDEKIPLNARPSGLVEETPHPSGAVFRYGMLAFILGLLGFYLHWLAGIPASYPYERYGCGIVTLMMLFGHLAWHFRWSPGVTRALRIFSGAWTLFSFVYVCFLSR